MAERREDGKWFACGTTDMKWRYLKGPLVSKTSADGVVVFEMLE